MTPYLAPGAYLPHETPMLLLESVLTVSDSSARCRVTVSSQGVLAPFLTAEGDLPAWYAMELMAQTVGVWSGWHRTTRGEPGIALGMILGVRDLQCQHSVFARGSVLDIDVTLLLQDEKFGSFDAVIHSAGASLARGRINTFQPDNAELNQLFSQGAST
ncbi:3-hydroxy-fatty acyl-ACP dehydratase [Cronobacter dublinensis]|uniref:ApeP family dehydratase n=1 Tax=Cronobacter dublinensis TaxID=413497 RepID=UPI0029DDF407|nr:3-hydroxy-fatty acyl-ACP dehydratase [Cronobacter dublinensis]ELY3970116.1 3-hydroxy-fatty acyl-ACP dehydratase [Cronobacter dublinensis]ELY4485578.1 3-hydroxy-fatty acyl-ACP dehydratase [Cronobacter dublinensis]ELY5823029.1 3-hydroxy-fatty acyl-ACP dehydratase [Cronobacter dublinensis]